MSEDAPPLLRIRSVAKRFNHVVALRSADLEVRAGEVHALMGANGAGKSTLVKIITGVFAADAGEMRLAPDQRVFALGFGATARTLRSETARPP